MRSATLFAEPCRIELRGCTRRGAGSHAGGFADLHAVPGRGARGGSRGDGAQSLVAGGVRSRCRTWPLVPGRRRGRHFHTACGMVLLAEFGGRYVTALCALPGIGERSKPPVPIPADGESGHDGRGRSADDRRGICDRGGPGQSVAGHGCGLRCRIGAIRGSPCRSSSKAAIRPGTWSGAFISISPRTGRTRRPRSRSSLPTRRGFRPRPRPQHLPLGKALQEYAGARNRERLLSLLMPVQRAAEHCAWLKAMVDAGEIFHPLRWSPQQALQFLQRCSGVGKRRRGRAHAGKLAHEPSSAPAGEGDGRRQAAVAVWGWMRCSTSGWR